MAERAAIAACDEYFENVDELQEYFDEKAGEWKYSKSHNNLYTLVYNSIIEKFLNNSIISE